MKLKYLTESAYEQLYKGITKNLSLYTNKKPILATIFPHGGFAKESNIVIQNINLVDDDLTNVKILFTEMKKLTPEQASNVYLWTWLTHDVFYDYAQERWQPEGEGTIKDRFFCDSFKGSRIGLFRNAIARLWWYGYMTYQEGRSNPFYLTEILLSSSDLSVQILERKFGMNKNIVVGILSAISELNDSQEYDNVVMDEWRELTKYLNRYGGATMLDFLSPEEIKEESIKFILNRRKNKNSKII